MSGEHPNKSDVGFQFARRGLDVAGVDMLIDFPNSAVAFGPLRPALLPGRNTSRHPARKAVWDPNTLQMSRSLFCSSSTDI
jgi:hypothetical protein